MGIILRTEPIGEYDRRIVVLTKDYGKISAFAKGARRQTNRLMACTDLFCFGQFKFYPGRSSYTLTDANIQNYFKDFGDNFEAAMYGMYFLEVMEYHTRENNDEKEMLKLLYQSLRALLHEAYDNRLVRAIFELKTMALLGEYRGIVKDSYSEAAKYAVDYIYHQTIEKLFSFSLSETVLAELLEICEEEKRILWNHTFKSEEMLSVLAK